MTRPSRMRVRGRACANKVRFGGVVICDSRVSHEGIVEFFARTWSRRGVA